MKRVLAVGAVGPRWGGAALAAEGYSPSKMSEMGWDYPSYVNALDSLFGEAQLAQNERTDSALDRVKKWADTFPHLYYCRFPDEICECRVPQVREGVHNAIEGTDS